MSKPLAGQLALVTGGTRGIGRAIAMRLKDDGASVTITGTRPYRDMPDGCEYRVVDFSDLSATKEFATEIASWNLNVLVNCAGINKVASFDDIDPEDFDRIQTVNVRAPFLFCRAVLPSMRRKGSGRIINIGSIFGTVSKAKRGSYSTSKFAINGMTAALAAEVAADGILVNCVSPGFIDTELTRGVLGETGISEVIETVPMRRLGRPEEVAALVAWLAGPENTFISGQNIIIDGGFTRV